MFIAVHRSKVTLARCLLFECRLLLILLISQFLPGHQRLSKRVRKRLYYGLDQDVSLDALSCPVTGELCPPWLALSCNFDHVFRWWCLFPSCRHCSWILPKVCAKPHPQAPQEIRRTRFQVGTVCAAHRISNLVQARFFLNLFVCFSLLQGGMYLSMRHDAGSRLHRTAPTQKPWIPPEDLFLWPFSDLHGMSALVQRSF